MPSKINVSKGAKIRKRYNQVPHLTQDTNRKVTNSQLDTTNERQEVSPSPASDHKAQINRQLTNYFVLTNFGRFDIGTAPLQTTAAETLQ